MSDSRERAAAIERTIRDRAMGEPRETCNICMYTIV